MEGDGKDLQTKGGDRERESGRGGGQESERGKGRESMRIKRGDRALGCVCVSVWRGVKGKGGKIKRGECVGMRECV